MKIEEYSESYNKLAVSQYSAGKYLLEILFRYRNKPFKKVADIGCGSGGLSSYFFNELKPESMICYDISPSMINIAKQANNFNNITFEVCSAEGLRDFDQYDLVISNSAFQWFTQQDLALNNMYFSLRSGGVIALQSSAKENWCPQFLSAIEAVKNHPITAQAYKHYTFPVRHYETPDEYKKLLKNAGFDVLHCEISIQRNETDLEGALNIFKSGAVKAFLLEDYFSIHKPESYDKCFMEILEEGLSSQCDKSGNIVIEYPRVFIIGEKPRG